MCVTDRHDMTIAVKTALNPNTTNQPIKYSDNRGSAIRHIGLNRQFHDYRFIHVQSSTAFTGHELWQYPWVLSFFQENYNLYLYTDLLVTGFGNSVCFNSTLMPYWQKNVKYVVTLQII